MKEYGSVAGANSSPPVLLTGGGLTGRVIIQIPADEPHLVRTLAAGTDLAVTVDYLRSPPASWSPPATAA